MKTLDLIGNKAVARPFSEKKLLKHALLDLCKQIYANLYAIKTLLAEFHDERNNLKRVPIALITRGAIADCLTGVYLITFRNSDESLKNEIDVMSREYAKFLRFFEDEKIRYLQKFETLEAEEELKKWESNFKNSHPQLFVNKEDTEWRLKSAKSLRSTSEIKLSKELDGNLTEEKKAKRIKRNDKNEDYGLLYVGFKYFSQYQHYSFSNRKMIEDLREEFFGILLMSIASIATTTSLFSSILGGEGNEDEIKRNYESINLLFETLE
ncbi:hypothetical protein [Reichenbachiella sp. MSK19-1]|uniref:hypothetical protein n=1 Tax=Reichenbachiella sp. MSK19-1 TaxID=1897631 RepID=UPI0011C42343|nr:hypothetical protein [Reichenbachiella sp. MSK19-1]